ncbi:hypothetical protein OG883_44460 [Streptomyces sp. NBC_01142]|uniref:hypothetical protein n=1 Tax=Streptomyces sp. NBC_01142 TaxID=2975865 RepID=UPI0022580143|nr:hypothetical protein [Streptomyces sp. NBC_01142]MCX4826698.1 hypothetical protein [Streptomyces sp. NBC_01142]
MILDYHRQKGGAPLLGVSAPGEMGPFGSYGEGPGPDARDTTAAAGASVLPAESRRTAHLDEEVDQSAR